MTSNGSLFTEELAKKAAEDWKIEKIQITLDGMDEEYEKRKRYTAALKDPFAAVIRSMHLLRAEGIGVTVRLNVDEENLGEIFRVVDFLKNEFSEEEKMRLQVYAHSLFAQQGEGLDACPADAGSDALEERVLEINDYIHRQGLMPFDPGDLFTFKSHYCMVTAPECNVLIDAEGDEIKIQKAAYIFDQGFPEIENFYSDSLSDTPIALCAEKAYLVTDKAQKVNDWPKLDEETLKEVHKKIETGWSTHL
jgi:sulfatase maturation enzyme AslB (radical SAM superfamily)